MQVIGTQVIPDQDGKQGFTVKFVGEGGEVVSVRLRNDAAGMPNRLDAIDKAKAIMAQLAAFDTDGTDRIKSEDRRSSLAEDRQVAMGAGPAA